MIKKSILLILFLTATVLPQNKSLLESKFILAQNYERAGRFKKAEEIYSELLNAQPWNNKYLTATNNIYLKQKKYDASAELLQKQIARSPKNIDLYGLLGTTYYIEGNYNKAFGVWDKALTLDKIYPTNYRIIANYAIQNRAFDKAIEILKKGEKKFNGSPLFVYDLANLYAITMNFPAATREYCKILKRQPSQLSFVKNRISTYIQSKGAFEASEKVVKNFYEETSSPVFLDLLSAIYIQTKHFKRAFETVRKTDEVTNAGGSKIFGFAEKALNEDEYSIAAKAYKYLFENFKTAPFIPTAKLGYAKSEEKILTQKINAQTWAPFESPKNIDAHTFETVINAYLEAAQKYHNPSVKSEAFYRIGKIYKEYLTDSKSALRFFKKVVKEFPFSKYAMLSKIEIAKIELAQGKFKQATGLLKKSAGNRSSPSKIKNEALFLLAKENYWQGKFGKALGLLSKLTRNLSADKANDALELSMVINIFRKDSLTLFNFARADYFTFCGKQDSAKSVLLELDKKGNNFVLKDLAEFKLAETSLALDDVPTAIAILDSISKKENLSLFADKALFLLAEINEYKIKNYKEAELLYEKLLEKFPNSLYFDKSRQKINSLKEKFNGI